MENQDIRFSGKFIINDEEKIGNLIYNEANGVILLFIDDRLSSENPFGKTPRSVNLIYGEVTSGHKVTLFDCEVASHNTTVFQYARIRYEVKYLIWGEHFDENFKFNSIILKTANLLDWSGLGGITAEFGFDNKSSNITHNFSEPQKLEIGDYSVIFQTTFRSDFFSSPIPEKAITEEHLQIKIVSVKDVSVENLLTIKNLIVDFISFALKNNVEVLELKLNSNNRKQKLGDDAEKEYYINYDFIIAEQKLTAYKRSLSDYNFSLSDLINAKCTNKDFFDCLVKLQPVLGLYLMPTRYSDMPIEIIFLNLMQALETFHARFICNKKNDFKKRIEEHYEKYFCDIIWSRAQQGAKDILLISRIYDLLLGKYDGLFDDYYHHTDFPERLKNTRNYFTHYDESKKNGILLGEELEEAISILMRVLEYHICSVLGIDIRQKIVERINYRKFLMSYKHKK